MTKSIRISEKVYNALKIHVVKNKKGIVEFADRAILNQIKSDKLESKILQVKPN